ncbi:hypothetical protein [Thioclava sp. GXIMD4215]|uniref:hypothetical protein n=1 Tax=Thioclava sp. GXIMD4215 TaxID=3131928 RepID=UPI0032499FBE
MGSVIIRTILGVVLRSRSTGILNNELYIGHQVWNRLSYHKHPETGRRVIAIWPTELPRPERNSWQRSYQDGRRKSQGDAGPVRYRRKLSRSTQLVTLPSP